jgi:hypothetical protein
MDREEKPQSESAARIRIIGENRKNTIGMALLRAI